MRTRAANLRELNAPGGVEEIELDSPKAGEVLVKLSASGMCHSDEHVVTGDLAGATPPMPIIGGHEGAGVVVEVGEGVSNLAVGDHVVFGFIPACGRCESCVTGHSNLCDAGGEAFPLGLQMTDGTARHHDLDGNDLTLMCLLGTFAEHTVVNEASCVKIQPDWPLDKACLLGCGVVTGWGTADYAADIQPGEYVAVEFKREKAMEFGATHTYSSIQEALENMGDSTWGRGFDKVIMTMGVGDGDALGQAFWLGAKRSKIVVTNIHPTAEQSIAIPAAMLTLFEKQVVGSLFGSGNIRRDIPRLLELYTQGQLNLDDLVTRTYTLDQINEGYDAMRNGENIRGVIFCD